MLNNSFHFLDKDFLEDTSKTKKPAWQVFFAGIIMKKMHSLILSYQTQAHKFYGRHHHRLQQQK